MTSTESSMVRKGMGRCLECGTIFDLGIIPAGVRDEDFRCQAVIGHVDGGDRAYVALGAPPMHTIRTEQGITPVRPCGGRLEIKES